MNVGFFMIECLFLAQFSRCKVGGGAKIGMQISLSMRVRERGERGPKGPPNLRPRRDPIVGHSPRRCVRGVSRHVSPAAPEAGPDEVESTCDTPTRRLRQGAFNGHGNYTWVYILIG